MLDSAIKSELAQYFAKLTKLVTLKVYKTDHSAFEELWKLLNEVASISPMIEITLSDQTYGGPCFELELDGRFTGIRFRGVPNGHEFSSLILAILNANGLGRLPDDGLAKRIKRLKGPIAITTYVSLTCENCPTVVQAFNQMALLRNDFTHEMVDGAAYESEVHEKNLQGVPAVFFDSRLIHSGRSTMGELIATLEREIGIDDRRAVDQTSKIYDVAIIGAGPAGTTAAIYSARKGLKTAMIANKIGGQVQDTLGIENLISLDYVEGPELAAALAERVRKHEIEFMEHRVVEGIDDGPVKTIRLQGGETCRARQVIVATGAKWRELGVPGEQEYLGRGVAFCPHCDGPYFKGKVIAVVGGGNSGVEAAIDLAAIVQHVTLLEFGDKLRADKVLLDRLNSLPNITVATQAKTTQIKGNGTKVVGLVYEDLATGEAKSMTLDGVFVQIGLSPNSGFLPEGVRKNKANEIEVDGRGRTSVSGIYAAGDVTNTPFKQIVISMGEGAKAALSAFEDRMRQTEGA